MVGSKPSISTKFTIPHRFAPAGKKAKKGVKNGVKIRAVLKTKLEET
jgi:hypothetical protein